MASSTFGHLRHLAYACAGIALLTGTAGGALAQNMARPEHPGDRAVRGRRRQ